MAAMSETHDSAASAQPVLLLVDGSSYLYRAFHAMPDLRAVPGDVAYDLAHVPKIPVALRPRPQELDDLLPRQPPDALAGAWTAEAHLPRERRPKVRLKLRGGEVHGLTEAALDASALGRGEGGHAAGHGGDASMIGRGAGRARFLAYG